jgi:hypothetical protein
MRMAVFPLKTENIDVIASKQICLILSILSASFKVATSTNGTASSRSMIPRSRVPLTVKKPASEFTPKLSKLDPLVPPLCPPRNPPWSGPKHDGSNGIWKTSLPVLELSRVSAYLAGIFPHLLVQSLYRVDAFSNLRKLGLLPSPESRPPLLRINLLSPTSKKCDFPDFGNQNRTTPIGA